MRMSVATAVSIERLSRENQIDFHRVHCDAAGNGWCQCVAWWVPTWGGWGERSGDENARLRADLLNKGIFDGYLIHARGELAGWIQAWERDAFEKLTTQFRVERDPQAWMIGCVLILPAFRGDGVARSALRQIVADLKSRGARSIDAYPKRGATEAGELWNGPESTYVDLGFKIVHDDPKRPVLRLSF